MNNVITKYNITYRNISSHRFYNNSNYTKIINIEHENFFKLQNHNVKLDLHVYDFMQSLKFDFLVFREAYINQRKKYKLLKAYNDLINELINEEEYDRIEDESMIVVNEYDEDISINVLYSFLKKHNQYEDTYDAMELSEILGIDYKQINKFLNGRTVINGKKKITSK